MAQQRPAAKSVFATWSSVHPARDDRAFVSFALSQVPSPPDSAQRSRELAELRVLAPGRTSRYVKTLDLARAVREVRELEGELPAVRRGATARWGCRGPRRTARYAHADQGDHRRGAGEIRARLAVRRRSFVTDGQTPPAGRPQPNYPSRYAVEAFSALTRLSDLEPLRRAEFSDMADHIACSRLYMAGHYRGDLIAGAFAAYLIGDDEVAHRKRTNLAVGPW